MNLLRYVAFSSAAVFALIASSTACSSRGDEKSSSTGQSLARDWSTGTDDGSEHILTLHVWSHAKGRKQAHEITGALRTALHDQPLALSGHRLINLRHEHSEARREPDGETYRGLVRFRATTEPE